MQKIRYSTIVLTIMLVFLLLYTIYNTYKFYSIGAEPSTLTACVYGFCGAEGGFLTWLKTLERKNNGKDDTND